MHPLVWVVFGFLLSGTTFIVAGKLLNEWVIKVNGGKMPVRLNTQSDALDTSETHQPMREEHRLKFLADIRKVGPATLSVGDVSVLFGLALNGAAMVGVIVFFFVR